MASQSPSPEQIEAILKQEPNADAFADKVMLIGVGALVFCLFLSWMAPKLSFFKTILHWMGAH